MLWGNPELSTYMLLTESFQKLITPICHYIIKSDSRSYKHLFHARNSLKFSKKFNVIFVINLQIPTRFWEKALFICTHAISILFCT